MIALRQLHDPLAKPTLGRERQDGRIADNVIDEVGPGRARIAEVDNLNRRRTTGQDARPGALGVAVQIDDDIGSEIVQQLRDLAIRLRAHVEKSIEGRRDACAQGAAVVRAEGDAEGFEACAVMQLEQANGGARDRMIAKIR